MILPKRKSAGAAAAIPAPAAPVSSTSSGKKKSVAARTKPSHPPASEMVYNAIESLKERGGSSLQAIKKYVSANYKVDAEKLSHFIKKYLRAAVASGALVQTKGKGASGSFKLAGSATSRKQQSEKRASRAAPKSGRGRPKGSSKKAKKPALASGTGRKAGAIKVRKAAAAGGVAAAATPKKKTTAKAKSLPKPKKLAQVLTKKPRIKYSKDLW